MRLIRTNIYSVLSISLIFLSLAFYFSPHVRGSDQYWYVSDVERSAKIDNIKSTNTIFPASLPTTLEDLPRPWVQNRPAVYVVALITSLTNDGHSSWVLFNCFCLFITAGLFAKIVTEANAKVFVIGYAAFLLFPLNFYLGLQSLAEVFNLMLVMILTFILLQVKYKFGQVLLIALLTGLLLWQRDNYLILVPVLPFIIARSTDSKLKNILTYLAITLCMAFVKPLLFHSHLVSEIGVFDSILNVRPGVSNMINFLATDLAPISFKDSCSIVLSKFTSSIRQQFVPTGSSILFFYSINILLPGFILLLLRDFRQKRIQVLTTFVVIHFVTVVLFQNQYRYACVIVPHLLLANYWYFRSLSKPYIRTRKLAAIAVLTFCIVICLLIGYRNRQEALSEHAIVENLREQHRQVGLANTFVEFDGGKTLSFGYAFSPSYVFYFPADFPEQKLLSVSRMLGSEWYFVIKGGATYKYLQPRMVTEKSVIGFPNMVLIKSGGTDTHSN